jgi:hypothetical protein
MEKDVASFALADSQCCHTQLNFGLCRIGKDVSSFALVEPRHLGVFVLLKQNKKF